MPVRNNKKKYTSNTDNSLLDTDELPSVQLETFLRQNMIPRRATVTGKLITPFV